MSEIHNEVQVILQSFPNKKDLIVFDVGACNFKDSLFLKLYLPNSTIYAFEPDIVNLRNCPDNVIGEGIFVVPVALSDCDDLITFYPSTTFHGNEYKASGSILKPRTKDGTSEAIHHDNLLFDLEGYEVQTVRIDTFCKLNEISHIDFLHMDVQGAEMRVISGLGDIRPSFIFAETCEFETYESGISLKEFNDYMSNLGYSIVKQFRDDTLYKLNSFLFDPSTINWQPKL